MLSFDRTDDKGPVYVVLETCRAFLAEEGALPLNVKFLVEAEEEIGSPRLAAHVEGDDEIRLVLGGNLLRVLGDVRVAP